MTTASASRCKLVARLACFTIGIGIVVAAAAAASSRYDPRLRFRTISTARFDIHFHQGEESSARRLARIAEDVAARLDRTLGRATGRVQVVLVNQSDIANGWATPLPYNLIEIGAAAPGGDSAIGNTDDWLRLVFTHEYTHIVHLGRSSGWIGGLRRGFGRHPALFPNLALPLWAIEGVATFEEGRDSSGGRVEAEDFRQIVGRAASVGAFERLDRVNGGLDDWPAGNAPYAYGAFFHEFLATRYGQASLRQLAEETGRRLPYLGTGAFRRVYGRSLGQLWTDFSAAVANAAAEREPAAVRRTFHGFTVHGPRIGSTGRIYYSLVNPHGFPSLMALDPGTTEPEALAPRYLGERLALADSLVVFDQGEIAANTGVTMDLYALAENSGRVVRLTHGWRASDPDVAPHGTSVVFTTQHADRRDLSIGRLAIGTRAAVADARTLASEEGTDFSAPRWSPDATLIAAERRTRGAPSDIVIVDPSSADVRAVVRSTGSRNVSPVWMPDGDRLIFASDRDGGPFRLFALEVATGAVSRLEGTGASAQAPDVSSDGRTLVFVGYTPAGDDLFTLSLDTARWTPVASPDDGAAAIVPADPAPVPTTAQRPYRPWTTLAPRYWTPMLESESGETMIGAATTGGDALDRHGYQAAVRWRARPAADDRERLPQARPDWRASYRYDRWWPTLFVSAGDDSDPYRSGMSRSREVNAGVLLPWRRVRWSHTLFAALHSAADTVACSTCPTPINAQATRRAVRTGWAFSSARSYGYSVSREEGWSLAVTHEAIRRELGADGTAGAATLDLRGYHRVAPQHGVVAARFAAAHAWGGRGVRRELRASGDGALPAGFGFGADAIGLLRGFDDDVRASEVAVVNLDYRFPLARVERGLGTWPAFARTLHGALFVDAGHAWAGRLRRAQVRVSVGGELSLDAVLGYTLPVTFTAGGAWRHDPAKTQQGATLFARIGRAF